jgi:uncharacterized protein (DUF1778 family)
MSVQQVTVDLTDHPRAGSVQMIVRLTTEDRKEINRAARVLGIPQADFLRVATLNVARKVLEGATA